MSLLSRQLALGADAFLTRYPHSWLVWEPGGWVAPTADPQMSVAETRLAETHVSRPHSGDALCFGLKAPEGQALRLGRAVENEIVISDLSVSRFHARLELKDDQWHVVAVSDPAVVGEDVVGPGTSQHLISGQAIELGGVRLAYYDSKAFRERVSTVPLRPGP